MRISSISCRHCLLVELHSKRYHMTGLIFSVDWTSLLADVEMNKKMTKRTRNHLPYRQISFPAGSLRAKFRCISFTHLFVVYLSIYLSIYLSLSPSFLHVNREDATRRPSRSAKSWRERPSWRRKRKRNKKRNNKSRRKKGKRRREKRRRKDKKNCRRPRRGAGKSWKKKC